MTLLFLMDLLRKTTKFFFSISDIVFGDRDWHLDVVFCLNKLNKNF